MYFMKTEIYNYAFVIDILRSKSLIEDVLAHQLHIKGEAAQGECTLNMNVMGYWGATQVCMTNKIVVKLKTKSDSQWKL